MEKFQQARDTAQRNLRIADHMLTITYPLVKDTRLLLAVLENIFLAQTNAMAAVLYYERLFKRIPPFHDTFESKYNMFVAKIVPKHKIDKNVLKMMTDIKDVILQHKKSPMEFSRNNKFVICSVNYSMKTISTDMLKKYIAITKVFLSDMSLITKKNEDLFK